MIPIVNEDRILVDYITWDNAFSEKKPRTFAGEEINVPVVIMAGGKGTRLEPFTKVLPKPLIPIKERTVLEMIIELTL